MDVVAMVAMDGGVCVELRNWKPAARHSGCRGVGVECEVQAGHTPEAMLTL